MYRVQKTSQNKTQISSYFYNNASWDIWILFWDIFLRTRYIYVYILKNKLWTFAHRWIHILGSLRPSVRVWLQKIDASRRRCGWSCQKHHGHHKVIWETFNNLHKLKAMYFWVAEILSGVIKKFHIWFLLMIEANTSQQL